ncbi:MAG TPA: nuclear transport factor 2 family protein [Polyangiaceae bacterium]|jgi:ketosteroid isomerase-like protein|nr:nuclear transport factor 2 family protein [Polyangiaceae bacterium]
MRIREAAACWTLAMREKNVDRVLDYYGPEAVMFGLEPPLQTGGDRASRRAALDEFFGGWDGPVDIDIRNLRLDIAFEGAFAFSINHLSGKKKTGEHIELWFRSTTGYRKIGGRWLIVHEHHSLPADVTTLEAFANLKP